MMIEVEGRAITIYPFADSGPSLPTRRNDGGDSPSRLGCRGLKRAPWFDAAAAVSEYRLEGRSAPSPLSRTHEGPK
jgi:hypothetical protein